MKGRNDIIGELVETQFVEHYAARFCGRNDFVNFDDIVAELYLIICELPESTLTTIYDAAGINGIRQYVSGIIIKQLRSKNSRIYHKYTKHTYYECTFDMSELYKFEAWENETE